MIFFSMRNKNGLCEEGKEMYLVGSREFRWEFWQE
jgi:hypothetical protein